jgi:hypothetical protein
MTQPRTDIAHGISAVLRSPARYSGRAVQFIPANLVSDVIIKSYLQQVECLLVARSRWRE